ncbi:MAG: glutamate synthase large subunit [Candidatus Goldiibacteriota bacterium]
MNGYMPKKQGLYDPAFEHDACGVGFIVNINGAKSNKTVKDGMRILDRMTHRGATGSDPMTGDGAGIMIQIPHEFYKNALAAEKTNLPEPGGYGTGIIFLPREDNERKKIKDEINKITLAQKQKVLCWRDVPADETVLGPVAASSKPVFEQIFIEKGQDAKDSAEFERILYVIRKMAEKKIKNPYFYVTHLSSSVVIYKGLMLPGRIADFFTDLKDEKITSALCLVHSRYSTNTFPTWDLAQPLRYLAHNGEINTLRGNLNWMKAREGLFESPLFKDNTQHLKPVIKDESQSDSASIDNAFESLFINGRSMPHSMMMLVPEAWEHNKLLSNSVRSFYKYHACFMEPWDGPATLAFTDGARIGAVLDRNGLRPARYIITNDGFVVLASEAGVLDIEPSNINRSLRLEPGRILYIDTKKGRIINDPEIKDEMARRAPYRQWRKEQLVYLEDLAEPDVEKKQVKDLQGNLRVFGYTREDMKDIIKPMAENGKEPIGSMGNDMPHSVLSKKSRLLYTYFKELFAQVTNPAIDSEREDIVMSLRSFIGPQRNMFAETARHTHKLQVREPILTNSELEKIRGISLNGFKTKTISLLIMGGSTKGFTGAIERICEEAVNAVNEGYSFIILSDRGVTNEYTAIPALLALGAVHQRLVSDSLRTSAALILETGEPREVHHFCVLFGFGADVINPYMAYESIKHMCENGQLEQNYDEAAANYRQACHKGIKKVMAKMGISTIQSYRGAQIFEALGIHEEVTERCFKGVVSRIGGVTFEEIAKEVINTHEAAFNKAGSRDILLPSGGIYQWKKDGEFHLWNPDSIAALQYAVKNNDKNRYKEFTKIINDQSAQPATLRSLLKFRKQKPVPIEEVEPVSEIVKRFVIGAMSFGSISKGAHESMAIAMNRLGGRSNTGEGGEDPMRFKPYPDGNLARSAIKQVASGRFGVNINYLTNADEIQIKVAQGAKPGEGGQLPGHKVSEIIARTRYTTPGVTLISPPPHHDIYSIEDLKQLIFDLKNANPRAKISVKLVSETGVGTVAAGVAKAFADGILISGADGGTGASPKGSIMHAGLPWELGLSEAHQTLVLNNLRGKVRLQTDGQLRTGKDLAVAACLGAEEYGFGTIALIALGCVMLRHCHLNNCSLGIATQNELLQRKFAGKPEYVENFMRFIAEDMRGIMAELGIKTVDEMIGRVDLLEVNEEIIPWKAKNIDFSKILYKPETPESYPVKCGEGQKHEIDDVLDRELIKKAEGALENREKVVINTNIKNIDRSCGAMLSGEVCLKHGEQYLPEDTIICNFKGIAGQSFGAFLAGGITFKLQGIANDYTGKGISGGKIIITPYKKTYYNPSENVICGNTSFYGAISGEAYIKGTAGERFCIRNSGLYAVVEGTGDHGCEYMTGGRVVVLGKTGRNFAAGMSGGIAYVFDENGDFEVKCNKGLVELCRPDEEDADMIRQLIKNHHKYTQSAAAKDILENFESELKRFVKVIPYEYKNILELAKKQQNLETTEA